MAFLVENIYLSWNFVEQFVMIWWGNFLYLLTKGEQKEAIEVMYMKYYSTLMLVFIWGYKDLDLCVELYNNRQ